MKVVKRNKEKEEFDIEKINKVISWAIEGIAGVSLSDIEINAKINIVDGISTKEIHKVLIESAANLFTEESPNYQWVASRLLNYQLRKDVWGGKNPPKLIDLIKKNIERSVYDAELLNMYSADEIDKLDEKINHDRDYNFTYAGIKQLVDKYLIQNRKTKEIYETPQFVYMLIAMVAFHKYPQDVRLNYVKKAYDAFSKFKINLPTPQMAGIRGPLKQYASCCLIDVGDSKESIFSSVMASGYATAQRYGIGLNFGRIRGLGTEIKGGAVIHTGAIPFLKVFESTVKSLQQNGLRGGGGTVNTPFWHWDIEDVIVLKNNGGTEDSRVRNLDYVIQFSKLFYERFMKNEGITLFSPHEVPELVDSWGLPEFDELYKAAENNAKIRYKRKISAKQLMSLFVKERTETGRIYVMNIDHCNEHGAFLDRVTMTNLCTEITFPTTPINHIDDPNGEIGICILSALNLLEIKDDQDLINTCDIIVRMLDELISYQDWFTPAAKNFIEGRRALGVGVTNLAALLAKNNIKYTDIEAANFVDEWFEKVQYHLLSASSTLAEEKGKCEKFHLTKYSKGVLPIDTYKKKIDQVVTRKPSLDWEGLRQRILKHGLRNSTLTAQMPVESSSVIQNSTNGIEPVRSLMTYKTSKASTIPVLVPNYATTKNKYTLAFDMENNTGFINVMAAAQKWIDQAISGNLYYNYDNYPDRLLPDSVVIKDLLYAYSMGIKCLYYSNTSDGDKQSASDEKCAGGACTL